MSKPWCQMTVTNHSHIFIFILNSLFYKNFQQFSKLSIKCVKIDKFGIYFNIDTIVRILKLNNAEYLTCLLLQIICLMSANYLGFIFNVWKTDCCMWNFKRYFNFWYFHELDNVKSQRHSLKQ